MKRSKNVVVGAGQQFRRRRRRRRRQDEGRRSVQPRLAGSEQAATGLAKGKKRLAASAGKPGAAGESQSEGKGGGRYFRGDIAMAAGSSGGGKQGQGQADQKAPDIAGKQQLDELQQKFQQESDGREQGRQIEGRAA